MGKGLWHNWMRGGKYLVVRRDGTVPSWPSFVIGAMDPAAPAALRAYAEEARALGMDEDYCASVSREASRFAEYRYDREHLGDKKGDPDAPRTALMTQASWASWPWAEDDADIDVHITIGSYSVAARR